SEIGAGGIGIGSAETGMVEGVESFAAQLRFPAFTNTEILVDSKIQYVHAARSNIRPTGGIAPHIVSQIVIYSVFPFIGTGWFVSSSGEILHTRPGGVERDIIIRIWEFHEVRGIEPAQERPLIAAQMKVFAVIEGIGPKDDGRSRLNRELAC